VTGMLCAFALFGQTTNETTIEQVAKKTSSLTQTFVEKDRLTTLTISYTQSIDEALFTYSIPSPLFEQSEAMKAIRLRVNSFTKEHGYYFYTYLGADVTKFDKDLAQYTSHFKFLTQK
ncbi:MAG TPA: hypothetical protein VFC68_02620, partial [Treponemataceae bacterium]|nr:hypothetical protein [Treponemataceae bacterium]